MKLFVTGPVSVYEFENLTRMFFTGVEVSETRPVRGQDALVVRIRLQKSGGVRALVLLRKDGGTQGFARTARDSETPEYIATCLVYRLLCDFTGKTPAWGMLTGVRPVHLLRSPKLGDSLEQRADNLQNKYFVSDDKLSLALTTARVQQPITDGVTPKDYSLYISIPFCPSRCSYCSFVSRTVENSRELIEPYVRTLCRELVAIANQANRYGLRLRSIYMGGGTPTSLSAAQLRRVMCCIRQYFPVDSVQEYTVEAGRPDCTDAEKLQVILEQGATRISINPQTLQDSVLRQIGRRHSAQDILDCFAVARAIGHKNINMDLIAGLPSDTLDGFTDTLRQVIRLNPENITVHTLTLKRASNLVVEQRNEAYGDVAAMVGRTSELLKAGYLPYYLYRQKGTLQNLENTGFCLPGFEGYYNVYIMEELHSIFSAGAGGVTKLLVPGDGKIRRVFNYKYPLEYVRDFEGILAKKQEVDDFYGRDMDSEKIGGDFAD